MSSLKDFRKIAEEELKDIKAGERLKSETLGKCQQPAKPNYTKHYLQVAACLVIVVLLAYYSGFFGKGSQDDLVRTPDQNAESGIFLAGDSQDAKDSQEGREGERFSKIENSEVRDYFNLDEVKAEFNGFLYPNYVPKGFTLSGITGFGAKDQPLNRVEMNYVFKDQFFYITEDKNAIELDTQGFSQIYINGIRGHVKTTEEQTDVLWENDGIKFSVTGNIAKDEAIKVANEMKK